MIGRFFEDGWQVWRATLSADVSGGPVLTYALLATVRGRMRPRSMGGSGVAVVHGLERINEVLRFYCYPTDVKPTDELRKDGRRYRVLFANDVMTYGRHYEIDCELVA